MTRAVGSDRRGRGFLASLPAVQRTGIIASVVVGCMLVAGSAAGLALQVGGQRAGSAPGAAKPSIEVPSTEATSSSAAASEATSATSSAATGSQPAAPSSSASRRAALVAFRRSGAVWVAGEMGGNARSVAVSNDGAFSLSPDGTILALVDASSGRLSLVTVATGVAVTVGPAAQSTPVWAPDSTWLVYRNDTDAGVGMVRVAREGAPPRPLGVGISPSITPDGAWIFAVRADAAAARHVVRVPATGGAATVVSSGSAAANVSETAVSASRIFFARPGAGSAPPMIGSMTLSGAGVKTLVPSPKATNDVSFTTLRVSPDGVWLAYQESGDDGYSRLFCVPTAGGAPVALSLRYDSYLIGWSASGGELLFAEGNTIQGETSRIVAVHPDGSGRRVVTENAGL